MKIGFAITSSYCTIEKVLEQLIELVELGYDVYPIVQPTVLDNDTRFGKGEDIKKVIEKITSKKIVSTIIEAERFGPEIKLDALVIVPATGNTIAKLANGITDTTVCMTAKATLRNSSPVIIGVATNDGLGLNGQNIMKLYNTKNIYFVPFSQDDPINKPNSLIANFDLLIDTLNSSLNKKQLQPLLEGKQYKKEF